MKVYPAYFDFSQTSGKTYDYYVQAEGSGAEVGVDSFGDCTMDYAQLVQLHEYDGQPFDCNGYVERIDQAAGGDTPSIRVDTRPTIRSDLHRQRGPRGRAGLERRDVRRVR